MTKVREDQDTGQVESLRRRKSASGNNEDRFLVFLGWTMNYCW
jgi:hypothetical protein